MRFPTAPQAVSRLSWKRDVVGAGMSQIWTHAVVYRLTCGRPLEPWYKFSFNRLGLGSFSTSAPCGSRDGNRTLCGLRLHVGVYFALFPYTGSFVSEILPNSDLCQNLLPRSDFSSIFIFEKLEKFRKILKKSLNILDGLLSPLRVFSSKSWFNI